MFKWFRRKPETPRSSWDMAAGTYISAFQGRLEQLARELTEVSGKTVTCSYSHAKGGVLHDGQRSIAEMSVLGEDGFPVAAYIRTSLEGESRQKLEAVFSGRVSTVFQEFKSAA